MVHWASNYRTVGRCHTISTNVTESRMKTAVKTKAKKTNNQASVGGSILKANMEVEAAVELAHDLDQTGMHSVIALGASASCWIARFLLGPLEQEPLCRLCTLERKCA